MKARTISVIALLAVLCIASFVLWNFTNVAAKSANSSDSLTAVDNGAKDIKAQGALKEELPASGTIELCEAVLPENTITDAEIQQRGPQSLHWINELYQGSEGHLFIKGLDFRDNYRVEDSAFAYLKRFSDTLKAQGTQLVILLLPPRAMVYHASLEGIYDYPLEAALENYKANLEKVRSVGIVSPDLSLPFLELVKEHEVYFKRDHHWTPEAAQVAATALAEALQDNETYLALPKTAHQTSLEKVATLDDSTYMLRVEAVCEMAIAAEDVNVYKTEAVESDSDLSSALFNDDSIPVVVAGTSHSAKPIFNVDGFLAEALSAKVLNLSRESGGQFAGLTQYLPDETVRETISENNILIWEREFAGSFWNAFIPDMRQLIPSIHGKCSDDDAVAIRTVEATGGKILDLAVPTGISGSDFYLAADVADLSIQRPGVYFRYSSGAEERLPLGNPVVRPEHFFMELLGSDAGQLEFVRVDFPKDVFGEISLRICKAS